MKIYTKTGDRGQTSLYGGTRVSKSHLRMEACGLVDELNSWIGLLKAQIEDLETGTFLLTVQQNLFVLGAELALDPKKQQLANGQPRLAKVIDMQAVDELEYYIDRCDSALAPLTHFILPGGGVATAHIHLARAVCRKAERAIVALHEISEVQSAILGYINRLSDYLFVLARWWAKQQGESEIKWMP